MPTAETDSTDGALGAAQELAESAVRFKMREECKVDYLLA